MAHVNTTITHNTYVSNVTVNKTVNNVSFNGGNGGATAQPTSQEASAMHEQHIAATTQQTQHERAASTNHDLYSKANGGKPMIAATTKAGAFTGHGVVATKGVKVSSTGSLGATSQVKSLSAASPTSTTTGKTANPHFDNSGPKFHKTIGPSVIHANRHPGPRRPPHPQAKAKQGQKQNG